MKVNSVEEARARYGVIENGAWADEAKWCVSFAIPDGIVLKNDQGGVQKHIYCNRDIVPALTEAFANVLSRGLQGQLKTFNGCFMIRDVRAEPGRPSAHSWALAIDLNASTNQLGTDGDMTYELAACFTDAGFVWGKTFHRKDPMHLSFVGW